MSEFSKNQEAPREEKHPSNLEEAIEILIKNTSEEDLAYVRKVDEDKMIAESHHFTGRNLRNNWHLWWSRKLADDFKEEGYPQEKPAIVKFFNDLGIFHADDMSGIILTSFHRKANEKPIELETQVKHYQDYWKDQGVTFENND